MHQVATQYNTFISTDIQMGSQSPLTQNSTKVPLPKILCCHCPPLHHPPHLHHPHALILAVILSPHPSNYPALTTLEYIPDNALHIPHNSTQSALGSEEAPSQCTSYMPEPLNSGWAVKDSVHFQSHSIQSPHTAYSSFDTMETMSPAHVYSCMSPLCK